MNKKQVQKCIMGHNIIIDYAHSGVHRCNFQSERGNFVR